MLRVLTGVLAVALRQLLNNRSLTFMVFFAFSVKENFYVLPFSLVLKSLRHHLVLVHWKIERKTSSCFHSVITSFSFSFSPSSYKSCLKFVYNINRRRFLVSGIYYSKFNPLSPSDQHQLSPKNIREL